MVLTSQLIFHFNIPTRPWLSMPVFTGMEQILYSFNDIETLVERGKSIYIASPKTEGLDFSDFNKNGIVLSNEQHGKCPELVKKYFQDAVVDLTAKDLIMEEITPESTKVVLSQKEKKFQQHLGFHRNFKIPKKSKANVFEEEHVNSWDMLDRQYKSSTEINYQAANMELESLNWRISRLVQRDGKTQCTSHLFMLKDYTIVLNLHHPKIAQLVALSDINVQLSAHFAMALALETQSILPHIESEQRQNLLLTDAMSRISENNWSDENELSQPNNMLRDLNDDIN